MAMQRRGWGSAGRKREAIPGGILARLRRAAQPATSEPPAESPDRREYAFLLDTLIDRATLARGAAMARRWGVSTHAALLASGAVSQADYAEALARELGVPLVGWKCELDLAEVPREAEQEIGLPARLDGRPCRVLAASDAPPDALAGHVAALRAEGLEVALAPRDLIEAAVEARLAPERLDYAVRGLLREHPASSARAPFATWQMIAGVMTVGTAIGGVAVLPDVTVAAVAALVAFPFLCVTLLRAVALHQALASTASKTQGVPRRAKLCPDELLPTYSVLVPLVREANVLPDLIACLRALDYPAAKLEILLVLEADDLETQAALLGAQLPPIFRTVLVPCAEPRTKPKALNYALQLARGDFVVVYDAEDRPEPDQLRRAWEVFRRAPPELGCLQAQLNIYNYDASWLARQFTIEYSALFDAILPALERLGLPVPLGGTSNHFPRATLIEVGAWDPFNVTEDADLGIRLARHGYHTGILASTTWEEAPPALGAWWTQRTRWLKGWMQTYVVHTRKLWRLNGDLGTLGAIGFHTLMGGLIVSALVHPLFYGLLAWEALSGRLLAPAETTAGTVLWTIAWINLAVGYVVSILVGMLSVMRRGHARLAVFAVLMPVYWLLISLAAYRALYHFVRMPYLWEKTEHGAGQARDGAG